MRLGVISDIHGNAGALHRALCELGGQADAILCARPSQPLIHREEAVQAALRIIDAEGLESFGLDRLAKELGVKAPSLYHHFDGKADILAQVARLVTFEARVPPNPSTDHWEDFFVELAISFRSALRHPNTAPLVLQYYPRRYVALRG